MQTAQRRSLPASADMTGLKRASTDEPDSNEAEDEHHDSQLTKRQNKNKCEHASHRHRCRSRLADTCALAQAGAGTLQAAAAREVRDA